MTIVNYVEVIRNIILNALKEHGYISDLELVRAVKEATGLSYVDFAPILEQVLSELMRSGAIRRVMSASNPRKVEHGWELCTQ
ncbi:MAG: hypothetical protein DRJ40_07280 [Thermoprotei archaeon]|nr:MAG: hypothetical protein DRJ40_07280 [Thermoprotei archaeon]